MPKHSWKYASTCRPSGLAKDDKASYINDEKMRMNPSSPLCSPPRLTQTFILHYVSRPKHRNPEVCANKLLDRTSDGTIVQTLHPVSTTPSKADLTAAELVSNVIFQGIQEAHLTVMFLD
jgi:hypothetical protein